MSRVGWSYRPYGGGAGHLQRVGTDMAYNRTQRAYRAYIDHTSACRDCRFEDERCPSADLLWDAYQDANTQ